MDQQKDILRNKSHCKCISFSREVINAIPEFEYANLATILITCIIINSYMYQLKKRMRGVFSRVYFIRIHNELTNAPMYMCFV